MLCWGNYVKCATCKKHRSSTKYGWQLISKWFYVFLRHKEVDEGMSLTWKLITDWSRHGDVFDRFKCLTWKALAVVNYHYNYATGEPVSAESSSEHQGFFFFASRGRQWINVLHFPSTASLGRGNVWASVIPAISGGLILWGVVMQVFVLLELDLDTFIS